MMGRLKSEQDQLFYEFNLSDAVPEDHLVRKIDTAPDLSWLRSELEPHYSSMDRPSIDPELMIQMLVVGYVFAIRSERLICREVQVNPVIAGSAGLASRTLSRIIRLLARCVWNSKKQLRKGRLSWLTIINHYAN
jgi:hypothetical protein